jgi:chromosome segregation protein
MFGFKSFVDRTVLEFDEGITAILGPNGCGKSNIVDAIRWVLGEQSAKQLRGQKMDDIIFKGTAKRKPVGFCEVVLVFSNEDRGLKIDYDEVAVKRRVARDGAGQYFLNNSPVRLKDLRELFFDSGVNNTAYSVIEQEKISRVLQDNSQEVRLLIEEGAGIIKYKSKRKEAQRKLDQTDQDLLRLRDIIDEIGREVRSLQRQVGKAKRYRNLYQQNRVLDLMLARKSVIEMEKRTKELTDNKQEMTVLLEADSGELSGLRAKIESTRPAVEEREAERHGLEESLRAFESELQNSEQRVLLLEHRIDDHRKRLEDNTSELFSVKSRREKMQEELQDFKTRKSDVTTSVESLKRDVASMQENLDLMESRFSTDRQSLERASQMNIEFIEQDSHSKSELREIDVRIENRREQLRNLDNEQELLHEQQNQDRVAFGGLEIKQRGLSDKRNELLSELSRQENQREEQRDLIDTLNREDASLEANLESHKNKRELLKKIKDSYHGFGGAAKAVLQNNIGNQSVLGGLADNIKVDSNWSAAIETVLSGLLDSVVVDSSETAIKLVAELKEINSGVANFLLSSSIESARIENAPVGGKSALEVVDGPGLESGHLKWLLSRTWLYADDNNAIMAASSHNSNEHFFFVSHSGLLVSSDGIIRGGQGQSEEVSMLGRGDKLDEIDSNVEQLTERLTQNLLKLETARKLSSELSLNVDSNKNNLSELDAEISMAHGELSGAKSKSEAVDLRLISIVDEQKEAQGSLINYEQNKEKLIQSLDTAGRQRNDSGMLLDDLKSKVKAGEQQRDELRSSTAELKLKYSSLQSELRELDTALEHRRESIASLDSAEERLVQENKQDCNEIELMGVEREEKIKIVSDGVDERERRRLLVSTATDSISTIHDQTAGWHDRVKVIEDKKIGCREGVHKAETELATIEVRAANIVERIEDQYKGTFRELVRSIDPEAVPEELEMDDGVFQVSQATAILEDGRRKIGSLGAVNHLAVEEYEQKKERISFLEEQLADVEKAKNDLSSTINQINRTASDMFQTTFEEVRKNYIAVFQTLFNGGRADLVQLRTDDPLESQIKVIAQPKGKRVDQIRLLSGGERCMTALSLLFAVYLVKPSPFCLLDEADAPLDDENVTRFVKMLEEFSKGTQFLVVTHNKLTMEAANHLYGITMMEKGVSSLVSVNFQDVADSADDDMALGKAIAARRYDIDSKENEITPDEADKLIAVEEKSRITMEAGE